MSKIFEEFDNLVDAVLENPADQKALASLAEWFQIYNNYDWGGDMYNIAFCRDISLALIFFGFVGTIAFAVTVGGEDK